MTSFKRQMTPPKPFKSNGNKSKGILDDTPIRKTISTRQGTITHTPTEHIDIVNKKYVDDNIPANIDLFLTENGSDLGGVYLDMEVDPVTAAEENTLTAIPANSTGTLMASFATLLNDSVIDGIVELPVGLYSFHIHCIASSATKLSMYAEIYHRTVGGTETLLLTTEDSDLISIIKGSIGFHGTLATEKEWIAGDRIVVKLYGKNNSAASRNLTIYVEGNTASRTELPAIKGSSVGTGDVTAAVNLTDETLVQGDGGAKGIKTTIVTAAQVTANTAASHAQSHNMASHSDDNTYNINTSGTATISGIIYADGNVGGLGLDVLRSANISINLEVGQDLTVVRNIIVGGTVDGVDIAARDHAESHTVASHSDTTATGANLNTLVGGGETALHSHAGAGGTTMKLIGTDYTIGSIVNSVVETEVLDFDIPADTVENGIIITFRARLMSDSDSGDIITMKMKAGTNGAETTYATITGISSSNPTGTHVEREWINQGTGTHNEAADIHWKEYGFVVDNLNWAANQTVSITIQSNSADASSGGAAHMLTIMGY